MSLPCNIYVPHDSNNTPLGTVNWFRSVGWETDKILPGPLGEIVGKYSIGTLSFAVEASSFYQLYHDRYKLKIHNISSSDNGCYWCEIEGNETCFDRSLFVNISVNTNISSTSPDSDCQPFYYGSSPVCATSTCSTTKMAPTNTTTTTNSSPTTLTCDLENGNLLGLNIGICIVLPVLVGSLLIILMMICCIGVCIYCRKRRRCKLNKYMIYILI